LKVAHPLATQQFSTDGIDLFVEHNGALIQASQAERHQLELAIHTHIQRIEADDQGLAIKLDLLRESGGRSKFKIENGGNEIKSETKTFAAIAIAFSQNPKYFKFAVNMFNDDPQPC
jgi:hypothetical protein